LGAVVCRAAVWAFMVSPVALVVVTGAKSGAEVCN